MTVGNKAASLIQIQKLGLPVPAFFIFPTSYFLEFYNDPQKRFPESARRLLEEQMKQLGGGPWAVRSSSTKEDGQNFSFAGLFDSFLGLTSMEEVESAIQKCWQSVHSDRVRQYASKNAISIDEIQMAVIVQRFIEPDHAGVLFTAHPLTSDDQCMLIEICKGRGENLVSGHVTPDQLIMSWQSPVFVYSHQKNQNVDVATETLQRLQEIGQKLQAHYGQPQDIEFAVKEGQLYIVQSRPITKLQFADNSEEWTTADFRDGGVSSDVVSPLMWSLYEKIFSTSLPSYFHKIKLVDSETIQKTTWYKVFYGRPYWNLKAVKDIMAKVPGFNEKNFDEDMSIPVTYEGSGRSTPVTFFGVLRVLPTLIHLNLEFKNQLKRSRELLNNFSSIEDHYRKLSISKLSDSELLKEFRKLIFDDYTYVESEYFQTIYNASNAKMEFLETLKSLQVIDPSIQYIELIADLGDLEATESAHELKKIAIAFSSETFREQVNNLLMSQESEITETDILTLPQELSTAILAFVDRFYYHSERELDLRFPRWKEDYRFILKTLSQILNTTDPLKRNSNAKASSYKDQVARLRLAFQKRTSRWVPGNWSKVLRKLDRIRQFLKYREEIRCHSTKMYYFIRLMALEVARRRLPQSQEFMIFYSDYNCVLSLLDNKLDPNTYLTKAHQVKNYVQGFTKFKNPNEIGYRYNFIGQSKTRTGSHANCIRGIGCSAGVVRAKARVIHDIQEASTLQFGEILVTRFTDPGWTPLFNLASGVVCENGGLLSHAALISREYGIPSVLNVKDATQIIRNGQEIEIDGLKGDVSLL